MSLKQHAAEVLNLIETGHYKVDEEQVSIREECASAIELSRLYRPTDLELLRTATSVAGDPSIEVINGTTQAVACELARAGALVLLNFASARNPGGGFLNGAKAQEEDLCRCSALYPTLLEHTEYYDANRAQASMLYTDYMIFSPNVPFFKIRGTGELLKKPFLASIITAPAPNSRPYLNRNGDPASLSECFLRRWKNVLVVAKDQKIATVLLGAWGCGAFGGDPKLASDTARQAIRETGSGLEKIVFAIPNRGKQGRANFEAFHDAMTR